MDITYSVDLAVCNEDHTWIRANVRIVLPDDGSNHTEGEIWEAACETLEDENPLLEAEAIGLLSWEKVIPDIFWPKQQLIEDKE